MTVVLTDIALTPTWLVSSISRGLSLIFMAFYRPTYPHLKLSHHIFRRLVACPDLTVPHSRLVNTGILLVYKPDSDNIHHNLWAQLLTLYSLLLSCGISIINKTLTRFHGVIALALALSPVTIIIYFHAVHSIFSKNHRLSNVLRKEKGLPRALVFLGMAISIALFVYIIMPSDRRFSQESCLDAFEKVNKAIIRLFFLLPFLLFYDFFILSPFLVSFLVLLPILLIALAWFIAICLQRREIWRKGQPFRFHFGKVWLVISMYRTTQSLTHLYYIRSTIRERYPFIYFVSVVLLPYVVWVATVELAFLSTYTNDNGFLFTFGQVSILWFYFGVHVFILALFNDRCWGFSSLFPP